MYYPGSFPGIFLTGNFWEQVKQAFVAMAYQYLILLWTHGLADRSLPDTFPYGENTAKPS